MTQFTLNLAPQKKVWTVTELTARIRDLLAGEFKDVLVQGEISNVRHAQSRHLYFTLKDAKAQIRCVCFANVATRLRFRPEDGLQVTVRGSIGVYEQRGEYQIYVEYLEPVGLGALQLAFEQLKQKLAAEGLFDAARKKPLPLLPRRIGVVTSPDGAAVRDILRILRRRFPNVRVTIYPVRVQGAGAKEDIVEALQYLNAKQLVEVIILARGGGSLEDLWAFNEEAVARAIAASAIPVISGVGHETDFTIADFVADLRASTPSNAAELVVRTRLEFETHIAQAQHKLLQRMRYLLLEARHRLRELITHPAFRTPEEILRQRRQQVDELSLRLSELVGEQLAATRQRFSVAQTRLASYDLRTRVAALRAQLERQQGDLLARAKLFFERKRQAAARLMLQLEERSPLGVLARGYAIAYDAAGNVLRVAEQVAVGDEIAVRLHRGRLIADVKRKE
jgi:exodeoxyribonuclease VII large subunit